MNPFRATLGVACACLLVLPGSSARAEPITWSYNWATSPGTVNAVGGSPALKFMPSSGSITADTKDLLAAKIEALGSTGTTHTFTDTLYTLTMNITDPSKATGSLQFTGILNGTLGGDSTLTNEFAKAWTKDLTLGENTYSVTIGAFKAPGVPGSGVLGSIGADVIVTSAGVPPPVIDPPPPPPVNEVPEPTSLLLAGAGLSVLGLRRWCARRRARKAA
ncbi:MAG: PEP-CTERM sorting domain-containing protein [Gemmataceae bacterium]|nr:PEP-CTERM sorting domain-containing protein [Gemmataceae bacterium]